MSHIKKGQNQIWLPYTQMQNHLPQLEVAKTKGSKIYLKDGSVLIDGIASWWSVAHGYNNSHITKEIIKQTKILPHIMLAGFANEQTYKLAHRLTNFVGNNLNKVFFSDSGSTAVEVAMKMAWQYFINEKQPKKTKFLSFKNSYHGDTTGAMSLADLNSGMHQKFQNLLLQNFSVELPKDKNELNKFADFIKKNHHEIAAIFVEPLVQCAGGMKFFSPEILKEIFKIIKKYDILFIVDECAVGFYRTGTKFAFYQAKIKPDILILGKALTGGFVGLAATLTTDEIYQKFLSESLDKALMHGPTFMGNSLACAAANASLDLFLRDDYSKKVKKIENILKSELEKCRNLNNVIDVRVLGAIGVVELNIDWNEILKLRREFIKCGVFLRPFSNVIYIMPDFNISKSNLLKLTNSVLKLLH